MGLWHERFDRNLVLGTHGAALGLAARPVGIRVIGL